MEPRLRPCPFCGQVPRVKVFDQEGNMKPDEYVSDSSNGLSYALVHDFDDTFDCPIAHDPDEVLGKLYYDSKQEAINYWNRRIVII